MLRITAESIKPAALFASLVALAAASRFLGVAPNFAAVSGVALFAGFIFRSRLAAVGVPIAAMLLSDLALGGYTPLIMASVYLCLALPVLFKSFLGMKPGIWRIAGASLTCSGIFFLVTNFAVWGAGGLGYPKNPAGLIECYTAGLPFFRYTLAGDLAFAGALFGLHTWITRAASRAVAARPIAA